MKMRRWIISNRITENHEVLLHPKAQIISIVPLGKIVSMMDTGYRVNPVNEYEVRYAIPKDLEDIEVKAK